MISFKTITLLSALAFFSVVPVQAAEKFDIDLKELPPVRPAKPAAKPQSLEIDLNELKAAKPKKPKSRAVKRKPETKPVPAEPPVIAEQQKPEQVSPPVAATAVQPLKAGAVYTDACGLARQVSDGLGLTASATLGLGETVFAARHKDRAVTIACGASQAEIITYRRLLTLKGEQLLVLERSESAGSVVGKLAEMLGLGYRVAGAAGESALPLEYVFINIAPDRPEIHLTISAPAT